MPRPIWSGSISFGLVTIPIRVTAAAEDHSISFHRIHLADGGRVRNRKVCELEDREVPADEIGKGYEITRGTVVPISDDELDNLPLPTAKAIEIVAFLPAERIDPIRIADGYYLEAANSAANKPYVLLRRALERSSKVAIAKYAWHNRERLGMLRVIGNAIALHALKWDDEVRDPASLAPPPVDLSDEEIEAAIQLMESMDRDDVSDYTDEYTEAVAALIEAKREGVEPPHPAREEQPAQVVDLMDALRNSVEKARTSRGEDATVHKMPERQKKTAAKRTTKKAAQKTTKKTARKTAKKASGRQSRRSA